MSVSIFDADTTSISIMYSAAQTYTVNARWTHPGATYEVQRIDVQFIPGQDYYRVEIRDSTAHTSYKIDSKSSGVANAQQTVEIPGEAWANQNGGSFKLIFSRPSYSNGTYSGIRLQVTYKAMAEPSTAEVTETVAGQAQTVILTNDEATVKHVVTWSYPGGITSGEIACTAEQRSPSWSVPAASLPTLYAAVTDRAYATGTVTVVTQLEDGTAIGTSAYPAVLTFPDSIGPGADVTVSTERDDIGEAMHTADSSWSVISGHTSITAAVEATAKYGATVTGILLDTPDGMVSIENGGSGTVDIVSGGSWTWTLTVTDSRGIHTVTTGTLTVKTAAPPGITALEAERWTSGSASGQPSDEGQYARIKATVAAGTPSSTMTVAYAITQVGSGSIVETGSLTAGAYTYAGSGLLLRDRAYLLTVTVTDAFGQTAQVQDEIPSAVYTIHRMAGGHGIAFGQTARRYGVEANPDWPLYTHGAEILELILDTAHPPGSVLETIDGNTDPNVLWPWTEWAEAGTGTAGSMVTHKWIRAR